MSTVCARSCLILEGITFWSSCEYRLLTNLGITMWFWNFPDHYYYYYYYYFPVHYYYYFFGSLKTCTFTKKHTNFFLNNIPDFSGFFDLRNKTEKEYRTTLCIKIIFFNWCNKISLYEWTLCIFTDKSYNGEGRKILVTHPRLEISW